jgi:diguanylate cyclase (GGDEF)-like protein
VHLFDPDATEGDPAPTDTFGDAWPESVDYVVPLSAGHLHVGELRVRTHRPLGEGLRRSLDMLAGHASLALENVNLQEQLCHRANHDVLTALPNRGLFTEQLNAAVQRARADQQVSVLFIDLDDFKTVNDGMGHAAGDALLYAVAERLRGCQRRDDIVARLGGDEFAVLLLDVDGTADAVAVAERMLAALEDPIHLGDVRLNIRSSIGIAMGSPSDDPQTLLRNADIAMYVAKARGKGRCEVFTQEMHSVVNNELQMRDQLAVALENDRLALHYQPIVDVSTGHVTSCEALMRWHDPERGMIPPAEFIPLAEKTGLITVLERWALTRACTDAAEWPDATSGRPLDLSVNLSLVHLQRPDVVADIQTALDASGLAPRRLIIEVTESVAARRHKEIIAVLGNIRDLGVRVALDDFGTGYSSLGALANLPVDIVKIDKSFIDKTDKATLTKAVVDMSTALELTAVAEGVESAEQRDQLREMGCAYAQGFFYARPVPAADLPFVLEQHAQSLLSDGYREEGAGMSQ